MPKGVEKNPIHRFGPNQFVLYNLPTPRESCVLGLVGTNGIGKTTALKILTAKLKPNFGDFGGESSPKNVANRFKSLELQKYFLGLYKNSYKSAFKIQFVDKIPTILSGNVGELLRQNDQRRMAQELIPVFELQNLLHKPVEVLSGGELQRFAVLLTLLQDVSIFVFDEPTNYLDIKQRLRVAEAIRGHTHRQAGKSYTIAVEHDLSILDYMSDHVCCFFGKAAGFGVASRPYTAKVGINVFLDGFLPKEGVQLRDESIDFKGAEQKTRQPIPGQEDANKKQYDYPALERRFEGFRLRVCSGSFSNSEILVLLGENGTGKTTFVRILAGMDKSAGVVLPELKTSFKPQRLSPKFKGTVEELLSKRLNYFWEKSSVFKRHVFAPMKVSELFDLKVQKLSGGELQRVALVLALGRAAEVYLIDEPSAYLDVEQRITVAKSIKKFIKISYATAFVVEHDFVMASYLADKFVVYEGTPGRDCTVHSPMEMVQGMNKFLQILGITFRRDKNNYRPRINKLNSVLDRKQKAMSTYYYLEQ